MPEEEVGLWCDYCGAFFGVTEIDEDDVCWECGSGQLLPYDPWGDEEGEDDDEDSGSWMRKK
tara:strand:+ start:514 stop:699 length:186 start_codon:yes stop_codon:yes gene_type:complete